MTARKNLHIVPKQVPFATDMEIPYIIAVVRAHTPKMNVHGDTRLWCASTRMLPIVCASSNNVVKSVKGQVLGIALHR